VQLRSGQYSRIERSIARAVSRRRIFPYLAAVTLSLSMIAGFVIMLVDRENFPDYGTAIWWAVVTLATVGYGDVVPGSGWGRLVGGGVILLGVTFLAFLTATVTSAFVSSEQGEARKKELEERQAVDREVKELLARLEQRLAAIEERLDRQP
jgi:voltage-gated potassium channel